ncbi:MAG: hypothetical protein DLM50_04365 [Candidatus Meridianibacter frigidus]|nr:MAG: hypothetical protein DLM50_04365 [Candidatus Eremiobacteraeota bacterium]
MDDAFGAIKGRIADFAGYGDAPSRRASDEQVRAVLGEALALLRARHGEYFTAEDSALYDDLILQCAFMNQQVFKDFEYAALDDARKAEVAQCDRNLVDLAGRAGSVGADSLAGYLKELKTAFEQRDSVLTSTS